MALHWVQLDTYYIHLVWQGTGGDGTKKRWFGGIPCRGP